MTKEITKPDIQEELQLLETSHRDDLFKANISIERIKELSVIIFQCLNEGKDAKTIRAMTGLSDSQIDLIKTTKEYYMSVHSLIDNDSHVTQIMLRNHKVKAVEALLKKVDEGNMKAIDTYFNRCDKQDETTNTMEVMWQEILDKLGIMTNNQKNTKKLKDANSIDAVVVKTAEQEQFADESNEEHRLRVLKQLMTK